MLRLKISEWFKGDKKLMFLVGVGIVLILIIAFGGSVLKKKPASGGEIATTEEFKRGLELEVESLIAKIEGVGACDVMITIRSDSEYVYARSEKQNVDTQDEQSKSNKYEQTTIMVEDENGRKTALVKTKLEPTVKGVLVVCDGASDPVVEQKVTQAVKTVLGIGANNVCVTN